MSEDPRTRISRDYYLPGQLMPDSTSVWHTGATYVLGAGGDTALTGLHIAFTAYEVSWIDTSAHITYQFSASPAAVQMYIYLDGATKLAGVASYVDVKATWKFMTCGRKAYEVAKGAHTLDVHFYSADAGTVEVTAADVYSILNLNIFKHP